MKKIKCIIVDDEPLAARVIESYVKQLDVLDLVAVCNNAVEAYNLLLKEKIDVLFLDIKMPKISGIELIKMLENPPKIILITAYREYSLEGYELDVVDYLLKPVAFERFVKAVNKALRSLKLQHEDDNRLQNKNLNASEDTDHYIFVKSNKMMVKIFLNDILYVKGLKDYIQIITKTSNIISYLSLNYMEAKLPESMFLRVHRSYIVSIQNITAYSAIEINVAKTIIPIGRHYKKNTLVVLEGKINLS